MKQFITSTRIRSGYYYSCWSDRPEVGEPQSTVSYPEVPITPTRSRAWIPPSSLRVDKLNGRHACRNNHQQLCVLRRLVHGAPIQTLRLSWYSEDIYHTARKPYQIAENACLPAHPSLSVGWIGSRRVWQRGRGHGRDHLRESVGRSERGLELGWRLLAVVGSWTSAHGNRHDYSALLLVPSVAD